MTKEERKTRTYPYYCVGAYEVSTYAEARQLGKVLAERTQQAIHIMEKLDAMTAFHSLEVINP